MSSRLSKFVGILLLPIISSATMLGKSFALPCEHALFSHQDLIEVPADQSRFLLGVLAQTSDGSEVLGVAPYLSNHAQIIDQLGNAFGQDLELIWGGEMKISGSTIGTFVQVANETSGTLHQAGAPSDVSRLKNFLLKRNKSTPLSLGLDFDGQVYDENNKHLYPFFETDTSSVNFRHDFNNDLSVLSTLAYIIYEHRPANFDRFNTRDITAEYKASKIMQTIETIKTILPAFFDPRTSYGVYPSGDVDLANSLAQLDQLSAMLLGKTRPRNTDAIAMARSVSSIVYLVSQLPTNVHLIR